MCCKRCIGCVQATLVHLKIFKIIKFFGVFLVALVQQGAPSVSVVVLFFVLLNGFVLL